MLRIDEQLPISELSSMNETHKEESTIIKELHSAAANKENKKVLELLTKLIEHAKEHFKQEEKLMQDAEYETYNLHKFEHTKQVLDLESILSFYEMTNDTRSVYAYLEDSLTPWIIQHVEEMDIPAAEFLKSVN